MAAACVTRVRTSVKPTTCTLMSDQECLDNPDFRATVVGGRLTIVSWHPHLIGSGGPCNTHHRERDRNGIGIADLTVIREPNAQLELIAKFLCGGHRAVVRDAIVGWAQSLGYRRVWLPDEVVDLDGADASGAKGARTRCPTCRTRWEDDDLDFWLNVRRWGNFPLSCPLCGCDLPQWEIVHAQGEGPSD